MSKPLTAPRAPSARTASVRVNRRLTKLGSHLILALFTLVIVYPVLWMVFASLKTPGELVSNVWGLPNSLALENYVGAWKTAQLGNALFNSTFVSLATTLLVLALAAPAGYALARFRFPLAAAIFLLFVLTMQAPTPIIPLYVMLARLGLTDNYAGLILSTASVGLPLAIFIFRQFFVSIPRELEEAAIVDGCSRFGAFLRVVVPISTPAIATVAILQFLTAWNEYLLPLILIRSPELRPLPLAIQVFFFAYRTEWAQVFAALVVGSLPMIIVYLIMQRQFIRGLTSGAVKG